MAKEPKTRRWVQRASSRPPPRAVESTAEIVGIWRVERVWNVARSFLRNSFVLLDMLVNAGHPCNTTYIYANRKKK